MPSLRSLPFLYSPQEPEPLRTPLCFSPLDEDCRLPMGSVFTLLERGLNKTQSLVISIELVRIQSVL